MTAAHIIIRMKGIFQTLISGPSRFNPWVEMLVTVILILDLPAAKQYNFCKLCVIDLTQTFSYQPKDCEIATPNHELLL